jgi:hypothetical protein
MLSSSEIFYAFLFGVIHGTMILLQRKEKPFITIAFCVTVLYFLVGFVIGFSPLRYCLFGLQTMLVFAVIMISSWVLSVSVDWGFQKTLNL